MALRRLVLVGGGHAHVQVIEQWIREPVPGVELVVVAIDAQAPYSGMVPGWLAGIYRFDEITIDVAALTQAAAGRFVQDEVVELDLAHQTLKLSRTPPLRYDVLSINIGSTLRPPASLRGHVLSMRPLNRLHTAWEQLLQATRLRAKDGGQPVRVVGAGGGPAGVESLLCALARLRDLRPDLRFIGDIVTRDTQLLRGHSPGARRRIEGLLRQKEVTVVTGVDATAHPVGPDDIVLWATGAQAHRWPIDSGLAVDDQGFIRVDQNLRSVSHPQVHAAGDCCAWASPLPKAGVMAVRMGPPLSQNLRAALGGGDTHAYAPQRRHLALLATGDGRAVASWGPWSATGSWVWRWKDRIDRGFIARFNGVQSSRAAPGRQA